MRATVDLDDPSELDIIRSWEIMSDYGDGHVHGRVSSSGRGVHLKVHGCSNREVAYIRGVCGDDVKRQQYDAETTLKPPQILFSSKPDGGHAGEWSTDREHVLANYRRRAPVETRYPDYQGRY